MQLHKLFLLNFFFIALLSGCSLFNREKDIIIASSLPVVKNRFSPHVAWSISVGDGIGNFYSNLRPAYSNNIVYVADRKGIVKAINIDNGKDIWSVNLARRNKFFSFFSVLLSGGISVSNNHVYIGSERAKVYALNSSDGTITWQSHVAGEVLSYPVISNNIILIHTSNGKLQALNAINGKTRWIIELDVPTFSLRGESSPAVIFDMAIIGDDSGRVSAISIQQGQLIWQQRISKIIGSTVVEHLCDVDATPVVTNDVVYTLSYNGDCVALDLYSGQIIWKHSLGSIKNFVVDDNCIYIVDKDDRLLSLDANDGSVLWIQNSLMYRLLTSPVLYNNYIVVGDKQGYIHWINRTNGYFVAQKKVDNSGFLTDPIVAKGKLLIQAKRGILYAITC